MRALESRLGSVTAGNGAIYAVRRDAYLRLDPRTSHDLSFPFNLVKRGWRAVYEPAARAAERPVPTVEGEFRRKRRMMSHAWPAVLGGGMLDPRGYGPLYALEIFSHRALRYATPFLHVVALGTNVALLGRRLGLRRDARRRSSRCSRGALDRPGRGCLRALPLLRAGDRVAGGRPVGLAAARHARDLGAGGSAIAAVPPDPRPPAARAVKRALDVALAALLLLLAAPLLALACVAIRLESRGSPIYRQRRVGKGGRDSTC